MKNKNTGMPRVRPSRRVATRHRVPLAHTRAIHPPPAPRPAHFDASRRHERDLSHDGFSRARARDDVFAEVHARRSVRVNRFDRTRDGWDGDARPMRECTSPPRERTRERCARTRGRETMGGMDAREGGRRSGGSGTRACVFFVSRFRRSRASSRGGMRVDGDGRRAIARAGWVGVGKPYPFIRDGERRFSSAFVRVEGGGGTRV